MTRPLERLDTLVGHKHNVMQPRRVVSGTWWEVGGDTRASRWHYTKGTEEKLIICFWPAGFWSLCSPVPRLPGALGGAWPTWYGNGWAAELALVETRLGKHRTRNPATHLAS